MKKVKRRGYTIHEDGFMEIDESFLSLKPEEKEKLLFGEVTQDLQVGESQGEAMKAPAKLKIGGQEFVRQDLMPKTRSAQVAALANGVGAKVSKGFWTPERVAMFNSLNLKVEAKAQIPKELWAPIFKKIGGNKKLVHALKKLLKAGEPAPLMEFAKANDLDYSSLRKIMSLVNPDLHVGETLAGILSKAVRALKDAGVVDPIKIEQDTLWKAWLSAIDEDAKA